MLAPQDILDAVPGLTRDKLSYYVRMQYVRPKKVKRGKQSYVEFSKKELLVIERAFYYINRYDSQPRAAFEKAWKENRQPSLNFKRT